MVQPAECSVTYDGSVLPPFPEELRDNMPFLVGGTRRIRKPKLGGLGGAFPAETPTSPTWRLTNPRQGDVVTSFLIIVWFRCVSYLATVLNQAMLQ